MTLRLALDASSTAPPYEQVRLQVTALVDSGELTPGTRLPSVRALAEQLGLAANTVARAYRELEHAGVVTTRGRNGTVVNRDGADRAAKDAARTYADLMLSLGVRQDEALELVRRAFDRPASS
jgi:DNA-binding transcriptional regulator YhcF (GntR family)